MVKHALQAETGTTRRQPGALHVQALQVGVEVLAGAVHRALGGQILAGRLVAGQLGQVRKHPEQLDLGGQRTAGLAPLGAQLGPGSQIAGQRAVLVVRVDVKAKQQAAQVLQPAFGPVGR